MYVGEYKYHQGRLARWHKSSHLIIEQRVAGGPREGQWCWLRASAAPETMTLQNKQPALLKREPWGRLRKLGGRSTLLGKILFNIIWTRLHTYSADTHVAPASFLLRWGVGGGWRGGWTVAAAYCHSRVNESTTHTFRFSFKHLCDLGERSVAIHWF